MRAAGGGAIVTIGSDIVGVAAKRLAAYGATKGGVVELTKGLALECAADNIRVNCVAPGPTDTALLRSGYDSAEAVAEARRQGIARTVLDRLGQPAEIAEVIAFVASDQASFMTGALVPVDGGARAMGMADHIGRIAPGFKADMAFLDLDDLAYVPLNDPVNQLIQADDGGSVESVMIGGAFVYRDRRFTTIDLAKLIADARATRARLDELGSARKALAGRLASLVAKHCACFAARRYPVARMGFGEGDCKD